MKQTMTIGIAALLVGGAGGFIAGKAGKNDSPDLADDALVRDSKIRRDSTRGASDSDAPRRSRVDSIEAALKAPGQMGRLQALMDMYSGMSAGELEAAAAELENLPMAERMMASMMLFSRWAEVDPLGALAYSNTMGFGGMLARPTILQSWASMDPVNAAKYFKDNPREFDTMGGFGGGGQGGPGGESGAAVIAREWAKMDPDAALAWANGLDGRDKSQALVSAIGQMASDDPAKAAVAAASLDAEDQGRAYGAIASQWAAKDFASAEAWIQTLSGTAKQDALAAALGTLAGTDPRGAAAKLGMMESGDERDRAVRDVAQAWARQNPEEAASWLIAQQTEDMGDAMRRVMGTWTSQDSAGARAFIESQPAGEARDAAAASYVWSARTADPQEVLSVAESISDERDRNRTVGMTAMRWMREDEASARAYIEQSTSLSDNAKDRLLNGGGGGGPGGRGAFGGQGGGQRGQGGFGGGGGQRGQRGR